MSDTYEPTNHAPDPFHDSEAYRPELMTESMREIETAGWAGDGSGEDDLADYNQNEADDYGHE